jgi:hypothetical protein
MSESNKCTAESCACGSYRPLDDEQTECHCGCPWCDDALFTVESVRRGAASSNQRDGARGN